jgi:hypothetical protein
MQKEKPPLKQQVKAFTRRQSMMLLAGKPLEEVFAKSRSNTPRTPKTPMFASDSPRSSRKNSVAFSSSNTATAGFVAAVMAATAAVAEQQQVTRATGGEQSSSSSSSSGSSSDTDSDTAATKKGQTRGKQSDVNKKKMHTSKAKMEDGPSLKQFYGDVKVCFIADTNLHAVALFFNICSFLFVAWCYCDGVYVMVF